MGLGHVWAPFAGPPGILFAQSGGSEGLKREVEKASKLMPKGHAESLPNLDKGGGKPYKSRFLKSLESYQRNPRD